VQPLLQWKCNKYYIFWVYVLALDIQRAIRMRHIQLWPAPLYNIFPHYPTNAKIFEKVLLNTKYVFWFSLQVWSEKFLILRINDRYMMVNLP
jgi:hypothetical protein